MLNPTECILTKAAAVALALGLCSAGAHAAPINYGDFSDIPPGSVMYLDVTESSADPAEDPEPLYGAPSIVGDMLIFDPSANAFSADAPPPDNTDGSLRFTVMSGSANPLVALIISEGGTYSFSGTPSNGELVAATLSVRVLDATNQSELLNASSTFVEQYDQTPSESGTWSNTVNLDLSTLNVSKIEVVIDNLLQASGNANSTAFIGKDDFKVNTPEPASALLALSGGLLMLRRRQA